MSEIKVNLGRKISLDHAALVGHGFYSEVYRIGPETVVKMLKSGTMADAEREIQLSKWALLKGIPTAISYDVVDIDGHPGLIYEMLGRESLRNQLLDHPEDFDRRMGQYATLFHTIHGVEDTEARLPKVIDRYRARLDVVAGLTEDERRRMRMLLSTVPETDHIVHCDCHFKNIKVIQDELMLIDLDTLSRGDPIFDFAAIYGSYKAFGEARHCAEIDPFFDTPVSVEANILGTLLRTYFAGLNEADLAKNIAKIELLCYWNVILFILDYTGETDYDLAMMLDLFRQRLRQVDDLRLVYR